MKTQSAINNSLPGYVNSYLRKYFVGHWKLETGYDKYYDNIVVIPAIQEYHNLLKLLGSLCELDPKYFPGTLFLFVINNSEDAKDEINADNFRTIEFFRRILRKESADDKLINKIIEKGMNIGFIDASTKENELPDKDAGVGLARKIGMDVALQYFDYKNTFKKILICLDADCLVGENYLSTIVEEFNKHNMNAAYVRFEHKLPKDKTEQAAIICYEIFLRYYWLGLKYANSPFAFPTIGSTMVCDAESYCKIGGMNKRKAAEDFYFLEKLAKVTTIHTINNTIVYPSSRGSWRVPFGTGQRVNRYIAKTHEEYLLYDPQSFAILKNWLGIFNSALYRNGNEFLEEAGKIHPKLKSFLEMNSFADNWNNVIKNAKSEEQIQKQKLMWFDGFRTLKLIHFLRDEAFTPINMFDAVDEIFKMVNYSQLISRNEPVPSIDVQIQYLDALRSIT